MCVPCAPLFRVQYFDFDSTAINLTIDEGRSFVEQSTDTYDVVVLDAFLGMSPPPHLLTLEAMMALRDRLRPSGVLVINTFGEFDVKRRERSACLDCTLREVFGAQSVGAHASGLGNVYHVATRGRRLEPMRAPDFTGEHPAIQFELQLMWEGRHSSCCIWNTNLGERLNSTALLHRFLYGIPILNIY